jgi:hypothetical protein
MKYTVDMGSGAMTYIPSFVKIGSAIQELMWGGYIDTQTAWTSHKDTLIFCQNKESILKIYSFQEALLYKQK